MPGVESRDFSSPDETRTPDKTRVEVVKVSGREVGRYTFEPGWRWSECIKPVVQTNSCQVDHIGYLLSGTLHVQHDDGTVVEVQAGNVYHIGPGHDSWVLGDEAVVAIEFQGAADFAEA